MSISIDDIRILDNKNVFDTNNEKYVISEEFEKLFMDPEFKILGFIEKYMFVYASGYICKYTMDARLISKIYLQTDHGTFCDNVPFMYVFCNNEVHKVTKNLIKEWSVDIGDDIQSILMDSAGSLYIITQNSRNIYKYNKDGNLIVYLHNTMDIEKECKLYDMFVSKGRNFLYVIGTQYYNGKCDTFIDKYNIYKGSLVERNYILHSENADINNEEYTFDDIYVNGTDIYIKSSNYIEKLNKKLRPSWKCMLAYNEITGNYNRLSHIEYDDESYNDYIYFCEDLYETNGYSYGKLSTNGNLLWKMTTKESDIALDFNIAIHDGYIYAYNRESLQAYVPSILALDNNTLLFESRDGNLVKIIEYNKEIYNNDYYNYTSLYCDVLKDGVQTEVLVPLSWGHGPMVDENGNYLVFKDKNKNCFVDENYIFKRLIGDYVDYIDYSKSFIKNKKNLLIKSKYGSKIRTKKPYKVLNTYDPILTKRDGDTILNKIDEEDIIVREGKPIVYFGLLADYFKFYTALITKRKNMILVTKDKQDYIIRKTNSVFKYYLRKLREVNLVVEYLMQNKILETMYPSYVEKLKHHTYRALEDVQESKCPCYYDLMASRVYQYSYDANYYDIDDNGVQIYLCKNLPFVKKKEYKPLDIRCMADMVRDDTIKPFMLFINGKAIKWSNITIIRDWHESFLIISNMDETEYEDVECILYPCTIRYGEDNLINEQSTSGLYFDKDGLFTTDTSTIEMRIEILDDDIISTTQRIDKDKNYIEMDLKLNQLSTINNIFIFDNGKFYSDNIYYLKNTGYNIYGYEKDSANVVFRTFYFIESLESKNMIFNIPNTEQVKEDAISSINGESSPYLSSLNYNFDFHFSKNKSYERNISEAIDYIASYDISLIMDYYKKQSNFSSMTYTGNQINERITNDGYLVINRQRKNYETDDIIVYKNGILYEEYHNIIKDHKVFKIPMNGILNTDIIEIIRYNHIHNSNYAITVNSESDAITIMNYFNKYGFHLYANSQSGNYASYDEQSSLQYDVSYSYINYYDKYDNYKHSNIKFTNPYFYGKKLNIISDRQFRYKRFNGSGTNRI